VRRRRELPGRLDLSVVRGTIGAVTTRTAHETATAYWTTIDARDWDGLGALLAEDVEYDLPQTRERVRGRDAYLQFNREYPGDWQVEVERVVASDMQAGGAHAATWTRFRVGGQEQPALTFLDLDAEGRVTRVTDFWPEPYEPPAGREHLVERY
jgi:ketosteroid isomerase-like protein